MTATSDDTKAKPRWERRKDARPQELLSAALDLFVERGYAATRLEEVAARAGVSKGTLYLYFANKEELFKAVVREHMVPVLAGMEAQVASHAGSASDMLRALLLGWWERIGSTRLSGISKLIMAESGNFPDVASFYHEEVIQRGENLITRILESGIASGEFRPVDVPNARRVVVATVLMLMLWTQSFSAYTPQQLSGPAYLECFLDMALNGMCSTRKNPPSVC